MTEITSAERERQRVEYLVQGKNRPKAPKRGKRRGAPVRLAPEIEQQVAQRERWSHKQGTPETHEQLAIAGARSGSLARLFHSGAIDKDQLAAAQQIAEAYGAITADVAVRTASLETRIDGSRHGRAEGEAIGRVHADLAYDWWRSAVAPHAELLLAIVVHDVGLTIAARRGAVSIPKARRLLIDGLDCWRTGRRMTARRAAAIAG